MTNYFLNYCVFDTTNIPEIIRRVKDGIFGNIKVDVVKTSRGGILSVQSPSNHINHSHFIKENQVFRIRTTGHIILIP